MSKRFCLALAALGTWLFVLGSVALANHELGAPPDVYADESQATSRIRINTNCPVHYIEYQTIDDTAKNGEDYIAVSGRLTNPPWEFDVPILQDALQESYEEVVMLKISAGVTTGTGPTGGGVCGTGTNSYVIGKLTILDDEPRETGTTPASRDQMSTPVQKAPSLSNASSTSQALGPAPIVEQPAPASADDQSEEKKDEPAVTGSSSSSFRFAVIAGLLAIGTSGIFAFSKKRDIVIPAEEAS